MSTVIPIQPLAPEPPLRLPPLAGGDHYAFHTMVKPSGSQCNLDCSYCFYLHKEDLLAQPRTPRMSDSMLERHIRQYIEAQSGPQVVFSWQGGEPTLMGLEFFRRVVALQEKHAKPGQRIENDLQTNGILLDDAWCAFLKQHRFLVGLSIDGPAALHDLHRYNKGGQPTFARVMEAVALLHAHGIRFNALCVVNRDNARRPIDVYRFLRDEVRPNMIQFLPGVEPIDFRTAAPGRGPSSSLPVTGTPQARPGNADSCVTAWSVDADDWGYFLSRIWQEWFRRDYGRVYIDQFENVISQMLGYGAQKCVTSQVCGKGLAIEHNGDLYSCDHYVYPEYKLGNIADIHQGDLAFSEQQKRFGLAKSAALPGDCRDCRFLQLCWGECPKNRFVATRSGEAGLNYLCPGLKTFYATATAARPELVKRIRAATA
ncbi:MAG TPA: anaerobic sulfatase maturase [Burkholderiaceae bacterium]